MSSESDHPVILHLVLTYYWYDKTESGRKRIEYRNMTDRWRRQIWERRDKITHVRFARGYTSTMQTFAVKKIDVGPCPIEGWDDEYYRIHFQHSLLDWMVRKEYENMLQNATIIGPANK